MSTSPITQLTRRDGVCYKHNTTTEHTYLFELNKKSPTNGKMFLKKPNNKKQTRGEWSIIKVSEQTILLFLDYQGSYKSEVYFTWPLNEIGGNKSILELQKGYKADQYVYLTL
mgnify:CR=1 FL=1|jgi:hypothetical protein